MSPAEQERRAHLVAALAAVRATIADACSAAGRDPRSVTLIAVTKTHPATDVLTLLELGVADVGENRDQEARAKVEQVAQLLAAPGNEVAAPRWHFLGQVQRRKARSVASYASAVHSVDRLELVAALDDGVDRADRLDRAEGADGADGAGGADSAASGGSAASGDSGPAAGARSLDAFVQVSLDGDPDRGGVTADRVPALADAIAQSRRLVLRGVMAVAPMQADPDEAFTRLAEISAQLVTVHPGATAISAGMSGDLAAAIRAGATHVRVGTALLGRRSPVLG